MLRFRAAIVVVLALASPAACRCSKGSTAGAVDVDAAAPPAELGKIGDFIADLDIGHPPPREPVTVVGKTLVFGTDDKTIWPTNDPSTFTQSFDSAGTLVIATRSATDGAYRLVFIDIQAHGVTGAQSGFPDKGPALDYISKLPHVPGATVVPKGSASPKKTPVRQ
jgi:hypothetical protein